MIIIAEIINDAINNKNNNNTKQYKARDHMTCCYGRL